MTYCFERGIPWSEWLERWSQEDRARVIAYALEKAERCGMCGTAPWEWDPEQGGSKYAYEAHRHICFGCQHKDLAREEDDGRLAGMSIVLIPAAQAAKIRASQKKREL